MAVGNFDCGTINLVEGLLRENIRPSGQGGREKESSLRSGIVGLFFRDLLMEVRKSLAPEAKAVAPMYIKSVG